MEPYRTTISGANPPLLDSELVIALVAPIGTNYERFQDRLSAALKRVGYEPRVLRLSTLTRKYRCEPPTLQPGTTKEAVRIQVGMHAGNMLRLKSQKGDFLALAAAGAISASRGPARNQLAKTAHILRSLKHPDEVRALRRIYGAGFYLIGITVKEQQRREYLRDELGCTPDEVDSLLRRDEHEEDERYFSADGYNFGQRTRDTFQLADVFIPLDAEADLQRFVELVFSYPYHTPRADEHAMFLAFAASLRSADLSRQVGAVIVSASGDVMAVGANDVARSGGGQYWPGAADRRDWVYGYDSNEQQRKKIVGEALQLVCPEVDEGPWIENARRRLAAASIGDVSEEALRILCPSAVDEKVWMANARRRLARASINDITEFGRATHAEMEALLSCARSGVSTQGTTLYSTTFPCHNCAKHIISAGVTRVVYVEPYPKSLAVTLFGDAISLEPWREDGFVHFEPFVGVGPRRFLDLFSMGLSSGTRLQRKRGGQTIPWTPDQAVVRSPCIPNSYLEREALAFGEIAAYTSSPEEPS